MIEKKELQFEHEGTTFQAVVTYNDALHEKIHEEFIYYRVKLFQPIELDCGGGMPSAYFTNSLLFQMDDKLKRKHYVFNEARQKDVGDEVNLYPKAINRVLYAYYNRDTIAYYKEKVAKFKVNLDQKFAAALAMCDKEKRLLKQKMKEGKITPKEYQKLHASMRKEKEKIASRISQLKHNYESRYFQCCDLKDKYRSYHVENMDPCVDKYERCRQIVWQDKL